MKDIRRASVAVIWAEIPKSAARQTKQKYEWCLNWTEPSWCHTVLHPWIQIKIVFSTFAFRAPAANQQARLQSRNPLCVWINHSVPSGLFSFILCIPLSRLLLLNERILCSWLVRTGCRHIQLTYKTSRHQRRVNGVVTLAASDSC